MNSIHTIFHYNHHVWCSYIHVYFLQLYSGAPPQNGKQGGGALLKEVSEIWSGRNQPEQNKQSESFVAVHLVILGTRVMYQNSSVFIWLLLWWWRWWWWWSWWRWLSSQSRCRRRGICRHPPCQLGQWRSYQRGALTKTHELDQRKAPPAAGVETKKIGIYNDSQTFVQLCEVVWRLQPRACQRWYDLACGNGNMSRGRCFWRLLRQHGAATLPLDWLLVDWWLWAVLLPWCLAGHWGSTGGLCRDDHVYHCQAQWLHVFGTSLWSTDIKVLKPFFVFLQTEAWRFFVWGVFGEPPRCAIYLLPDSIWTDSEPSRTESLKKSRDAETRGKMGEDCLEAKNAMAWWNPGSEVWILYIVVWASWMNIDSYCEILQQWIGSASHYLQGFIYPKCRISSINSIWWCLSWGWSFWLWFWEISRRIGNSLHEHLNLTLCARVSSCKAMQYKNKWHLHAYVTMYCFYHCLWRPYVFSIRWNGAVPEIEAELQMRSMNSYKNLGVLVIRKHWISRLDPRINPYEWVLWPWSLWRRRWSFERCHSTNDYFVCYASFYQTYRSAKKSMNSLQTLWNLSRKSWWPLSGGAPVFSK